MGDGRFELGLEKPDPGRALQSALTIAGAYIVGGIIPLFPYIVIHRYMNFLEIEEPAFWLDENPNRTPKTRLLEKAALVWVQSSVAERNQQQGNIFTRCWLKFTRQTSVSTTMTPPRNTFRFTFADCV